MPTDKDGRLPDKLERFWLGGAAHERCGECAMAGTAPVSLRPLR